jgi:hypothetical protein
MAVIDIIVKGNPHDFIAIKQLSELSGRSVSQINNMIRQIDKNGDTKLDICFPFPDKKGEESGMKFVVKNEKYDKFVEYCTSNPISK